MWVVECTAVGQHRDVELIDITPAGRYRNGDIEKVHDEALRDAVADLMTKRAPEPQAEFNEVFISDARCPADNLVGEPGNGWSVLQVALGYERRLMGVRWSR